MLNTSNHAPAMTPCASMPNLDSAKHTALVQPHADRTDTEQLALELVRETYSGHLLERLESPDAPTTTMQDVAASLLDRCDPQTEENIIRVCRGAQAPANDSMQARLDYTALRQFQAAIGKREQTAGQIVLEERALIPALRSVKLPSENLFPDHLLLRSLPNNLIEKLKSALVFVLFPGEATAPQTSARPDAEQIKTALSRITDTCEKWQNTVTRQLLGPVSQLANERQALEYGHTARMIHKIADLPADQLVARMDALDECTEDGLRFTSDRAMEHKDDERMGIAAEKWAVLHAHLNARERSLREAGPTLSDWGAAVNAGHPDLPPHRAMLCGLLLPTLVTARLQRSIASSQMLGYSNQEAVGNAFNRLTQLEPDSRLALHLEGSIAFTERLGRSFPMLHALLQRLLEGVAGKSGRLNQSLGDFGQLTETAMLRGLPAGESRALNSAHAQQLSNECRNTLYAHRDHWQGTQAQLWLQQIRRTTTELVRKLELLENDLKTLLFSSIPDVANAMSRGAIDPSQNPGDCAKHAFEKIKSSAPETLALLQNALYLPNGKFRPEVLSTLAEMRRAPVPARAALAQIVERFANRLRAAGQQNTPSAKSGLPEKISDDALLDAEITRVNAERTRAKSQDAEADKRASVLAELEDSIDHFLGAMPRTVSDQRRLDAISRYLHTTNTERLIDLGLNVLNRLGHLNAHDSPSPYQERGPTGDRLLAMVLPALKAMDEISVKRLALGDLYERLLGTALTYDKNQPGSEQAARKIAGRMILTTPNLIDMIVTMKNHKAAGRDYLENIHLATLESRHLYASHTQDLESVPEIGHILRDAWFRLLDQHAQHHTDDTALQTAIQNACRMSINGADAAAEVDKMWRDHSAIIANALNDEAAFSMLKKLANATALDINTGFASSPALHVMYQLITTLLGMNNRPAQTENRMGN